MCVLLCFISPRVRKIETRPPVALGSSPELSAFIMSLAPPVWQDKVFSNVFKIFWLLNLPPQKKCSSFWSFYDLSSIHCWFVVLYDSSLIHRGCILDSPWIWYFADSSLVYRWFICSVIPIHSCSIVDPETVRRLSWLQFWSTAYQKISLHARTDFQYMGKGFVKVFNSWPKTSVATHSCNEMLVQ